MELDWRHWPRAKALGIRTAINPDAHSQRQLDFVHNGVVIARKGWLDIQMRPERHNAVKLLLFLDAGGSMDPHVQLCEELFSAATSEGRQ